MYLATIPIVVGWFYRFLFLNPSGCIFKPHIYDLQSLKHANVVWFIYIYNTHWIILIHWWYVHWFESTSQNFTMFFTTKHGRIAVIAPVPCHGPSPPPDPRGLSPPGIRTERWFRLISQLEIPSGNDCCIAIEHRPFIGGLSYYHGYVP